MAREALIRRFRGVGFNLPDTRNDAHAEAAQNVFEEKLGSLSRRQGSRRAIEYKDDSPIRMVIPIVEPGGEYTGVGGDLIIQGTDVVGKARARSAVVASAVPAITRVWAQLRPSYIRVFIWGRNFDSWSERKAQITVTLNKTGGDLEVFFMSFYNPAFVNAACRLGTAIAGDLLTVTVTNPDGQSAAVANAIVDVDTSF